MDPVLDRGSMDPVQSGNGPLVHVLSSPLVRQSRFAKGVKDSGLSSKNVR